MEQILPPGPVSSHHDDVMARGLEKGQAQLARTSGHEQAAAAPAHHSAGASFF